MVRGFCYKGSLINYRNYIPVYRRLEGEKFNPSIPVVVLAETEVKEIIKHLKSYDYLSLIGIQEAIKILQGRANEPKNRDGGE